VFKDIERFLKETKVPGIKIKGKNEINYFENKKNNLM